MKNYLTTILTGALLLFLFLIDIIYLNEINQYSYPLVLKIVFISLTLFVVSILYDYTNKVRNRNKLDYEKKLEDIKFALDQSSTVSVTDPYGNLLFVNDKFCEFSKYTREELIGENHRKLNSGFHSKKFFIEMWNTIEKGRVWRGEIRNKAKDGSYYWMATTIVPFLNKDGEPYQFVSIRNNITQKKEQEEEIYKLAFYDDFTGLKNKFSFQKDIENKVNIDKSNFSVIYIDVDRLSLVNDTLGHSFGDSVIEKVSSRIAEILDSTDSFYRINGDEFAIILDTDNEIVISKVASQIKSKFVNPIVVNKQEFFITVSLGVALYPEHGGNVECLIKNVDSALQYSKKSGGNQVTIFNSFISNQNEEKMKLESLIRKSIKEDSFILNFQPKVNLQTQQIEEVEALVRMKDENNNWISPAVFIPLAEETGLILEVGESVLRNACTIGRKWLDNYKDIPCIAVNISPIQFRQENFIEIVENVILDTNFPPCYLELEITESLMQDIDDSILKITQLKKLGIKVSIDDFGTGYSSLSLLSDIPASKLKIDRAFIKDLFVKAGQEKMLKTIIELAHNLDFMVVAEGIETKEQMDFLIHNNCELGQGYYFDRPLPEIDYEYKYLMNSTEKVNSY